MHLFHKVLFATVAVIASSSATLAADLILDPVPVVSDESDFAWDGFYAGVGIDGTTATFNTSGNVVYGASVSGYLGANFVADQFLVGIEGILYGWTNTQPQSGFGVVLSGRAGYLVTPETLLYLSAAGEVRSNGKAYGSIGAGVELALTDNMSLDLEYRQSLVSNSGYTRRNLSASVLWHF